MSTNTRTTRALIQVLPMLHSPSRVPFPPRGPGADPAPTRPWATHATGPRDRRSRWLRRTKVPDLEWTRGFGGLRLVSCLVGVDDAGWNAGPLGDLVTVGLGPGLDGSGLLGVSLRGRAAGAATPGTGKPTAAAADAAGVGNVGSHCVPELLCVLLGQVDLVHRAVQTECQRPAIVAGDRGSVDVVDQLDDRALCHEVLSI